MSLRSERKLTEINRYFFFSQNGQFPHFRLQSVPGDEHDVKFPDFLFQNSAAARAADDGLLAGATGIGLVFRQLGFPETNVVLLYLLAVLLTAWMTRGYACGVLASLAATLVFNHFLPRPTGRCPSMIRVTGSHS